MTDLFARKSDTRGRGRHAAPKQPSKVARGAMHTLPILLVGTMAMSLNMTSPIDTSGLKRDDKPKDSNQQVRNAVAAAMSAASAERAQSAQQSAAASAALATVASAPSTYRVVAGDTVSSIATKYGLSTASVLALNGLSWSSLIFPGQVLQLTRTPVVKSAPSAPPANTPLVSAPPAASPKTNYTVTRGDTVSAIASRFGVSTQAVLTANKLGWSTIIYPGQKIVIPASIPASSSPPVATTPVVDVTPVSSVTPITPPPATHSTSYVIKSGDTVTSIAAKFGVTVQSILDANGLNRGSLIYAGRTLNIPGASSASAGLGIVATPLTTEMATNARLIIAVGTDLGVSDYGLVIALAAAMQESTLRNLNYGDRDSLGLFQQRPSTGWGTPAQVTNPIYAAKLFFGGPSNPNKGNTRGLLDITGWQSMTVTQAAQAVQKSGYPEAYAKWETSARAWLAQLR
ncbi:MAG: LysM peptidoglycan-binding domain-containing protein [Terrimesophilobacter sp.]